MNTQTKDYSKIPCIIKKDEVIAEVNDEFLTYTGFAPEMVLGKSFENVWSELLKISIEPSFAEDLSEAFLFTSKFEARKVFIQKEPDSCTNRTSYYIWDYSDSRLYSEFPYIDYLFSDDSVGVAMYSVPELILLKANQCYLSFLDEPYRRKEFSLGRNIYTIISGYKGSNFEKLTKEMISTGKVLNLKEEAFHGYSRGITYWDTTIVPIYEKECIKYIVQVSHEVTEAVANRLLLLEQSKQIATQKEELAAILENMTDSICIFDKNNNYILFNKAARELFFPSYSYMEKVGDGHYQAENYDFDGNRIPLDKIPANRVKNGEKFSCLHMKV
ncbi:MAG: PAS domain-containing protein, partial [Pseudomonadota bacterium]